MKKIISCLVILFLPSRMAAVALKFLGHSIHGSVKLGFSVVIAKKIILQEGSKVGHFNLIVLDRFLCKMDSIVGRSNVIYGPFSLLLDRESSIGNRNKIVRGPRPGVCDWPSSLILRQGAIITADHYIDCTRSVFFGEYSILAGSGSQIWTHGYIHEQSGPGRYRIDGSIAIGSNVYIGSRCIINAGIRIAPACTVGAGTVISKSLTESGIYVSASIRRLPLPKDPATRMDLHKVDSPRLCEQVYLKSTNLATDSKIGQNTTSFKQ